MVEAGHDHKRVQDMPRSTPQIGASVGGPVQLLLVDPEVLFTDVLGQLLAKEPTSRSSAPSAPVRRRCGPPH